MKNYLRLAGVALFGAQLIIFSARGEDTNTLEIIKQLQRRIEELEQKVKALEAPKTPGQEEKEKKDKQRIEELDQKVKTIERNRQLELEAAEAKEKSAPKITMTDEGFAGFGVSTPDKDFSLRLRG